MKLSRIIYIFFVPTAMILLLSMVNQPAIEAQTVGSQISGDVSCDNVVNTGDALMILQLNVGLRSGVETCPLNNFLSEANISVCDVNGDMSCNTADALLILQCNVEIENVFCPAQPDPILNGYPIVSITAPLEETLFGNTDRIVVTGEVTDDGTIAGVDVNGVSAVVAGGQFSATIPIESGNFAIDVVATDDLGGAGYANVVVLVDAVGPDLDIASPQDGGAVLSRTPTVDILYSDFYSILDLDSLDIHLVSESGSITDVSSSLNVGGQGVSGTLPSQLDEDEAYTLTVSLSDEFNNRSTVSASFYVPHNPDDIVPPIEAAGSGYVNGTVVDSSTCDDELDICWPLPGAFVTLQKIDVNTLEALRVERTLEGERLWNEEGGYLAALADGTQETYTREVVGTLVTGPDGSFSFPASLTGAYWVRVEKDGYTYAQREVNIVRERRSRTTDIYLTPLDTAVTSCDTEGCFHQSADGMVELTIQTGAIVSGTSENIRATFIEQVEFLPNGEAPPGTIETYAFNLSGDSEISFTVPITLRVKNIKGFAPGMEIPAGYWNQSTQMWEHDGVGVVDDSGEWVEVEITHFSWWDLNLPARNDLSGLDRSQINPKSDPANGCREGHDGCFIDFKSGNYTEWVSLPEVNLLGNSYAPKFNMKSERVVPYQLIETPLFIGGESGNVVFLDQVEYQVEIEGDLLADFDLMSDLDPNSEIGDFRYIWDGKIEEDETLPSGIYDYKVGFKLPYLAEYCGSVNRYFGAPPFCEPPTGRFVAILFQTFREGTLAIDPRLDSPFGAGWLLEGQQRFFASEDGKLLISDTRNLDEFDVPWEDLTQVNRSSFNWLAWANQDSGTVQIMSEDLAQENALNKFIRVGDEPSYMAVTPDNSFAYVSNENDNTISVIDLVLQEEVSQIDVSAGGTLGVGALAVSPDGQTLYAANLRDFSRELVIQTIDLATETVVGRERIHYKFQGANRISEMVMSPQGDRLYFVEGRPNSNTTSLKFLNLADLSETIMTGANPRFFSTSPDGSKGYALWVNNAPQLVTYDLNTLEVLNLITVGNQDEDGLTVSKDGKSAYVLDGSNLKMIKLEDESISGPIPLGFNPDNMAIDSDNRYLYFTYRESSLNNDWMVIYDIVEEEIVNTFNTPNDAGALTFSEDGSAIYFTHYSRDGFSIIDTAWQEGIQSIPLNNIQGAQTLDVHFSPTGGLVYVTSPNASVISEISVAFGGERGVITLDSGVFDLVMTEDGETGYVAQENGIGIIDLVERTEIDRIDMNGVQFLTLSPNERQLYAANSSGAIYVVDIEERAVTGSTSVGGLTDIKLAVNGEFLYGVDGVDDLFAVDLINNLAVQSLSLGNEPIALVVDHLTAYVANKGNRTVSYIDLESLTETATVDVRSQPTGISFSPDQGFLYVANTDDNSLSVVNIFGQVEKSVIRAGTAPSSVDVSNGTQLILTSNTATDYSSLIFGSYDFSDVTREYNDGTKVHFNPDGTHDYTLAPDGMLTEYIYASNGLLEKMAITAPGKANPDWIWEFVYTGGGKLDYVVDPSGRITEFTIDSRNDLTQVEYADGGTQRFFYDERHLVTQHRDENGDTSSYDYDEFGRVRQMFEPSRQVFNVENGTSRQAREQILYTPSDLSVPIINDIDSTFDGFFVPPLSTDVFAAITYARGIERGRLDSWGRWLEQTDGLNRTTVYERNFAGLPEKITYPDGDCVEMTYDTRGNRRTVSTMPADQCNLDLGERNSAFIQTWTYEYEARFNKVKRIIDPEGYETVYTFDYQAGVGNAGNVVRVLYPFVDDQNGQPYQPKFEFTYNQWNQLETTTDQAGTVNRYIYTQGSADEAADGATPLFLPGVTPVPGLLTQVIEDFGDAAHRNTTITYSGFDGAGNPHQMVGPRGAVYDYSYDALNRIIEERNDLGLVTTYAYDLRGNLIEQVERSAETGRQTVMVMGYNAEDSPLSLAISGDGIIQEMQYAYDINGLLAREIDNQGRETRYRYDAADQLIRTTDELGQVTRFAYTPRGELATQTYPDGRVVTFDYNARSQLVGITPDGKPTHGFDLTLREETDGYLPPALDGIADVATRYEYNSAQQLILETRPDGRTIETVYDRSQRLHQVTFPRGVYSYSYDGSTNQLIGLDAPEISLSYRYDQELLDQIRWSGTLTGSVEMAYDAYSRVTTETVNGLDPIPFTYTDDHLLLSAGDLQISRLAESGRLSGITLGIVSDQIAYNPYGEVVGYEAEVAESEIYSITYSYDGLVRISTLEENQNGTRSGFVYTYDPSGRLIGVTLNDLPYQSYTYDGNGNRLTFTDVNGTINASYDHQDRLLTYGQNSYTYAANGERTGKLTPLGNITYQYDVFSNLISATTPDKSISFVIDGQNRRVGKRVNGVLVQGFLYQDQLNPIAELDGAGQVISRFVYGTKPNVPEYMTKGGVNYRILSDHLGSVRLVVNAETGAVAQSLRYDPFGRVVEDTAPGFQPFGYAGGIYDADLDLVRFGARDYDPEVGRWTTKDPIRFDGGDTNLYAYVGNDPINKIDPSGELGFFVPAAIGGFFGFVDGLMSGKRGWDLAKSTALGALGGVIGGNVFNGLKMLPKVGNFWAGTGAGLVEGAIGADWNCVLYGTQDTLSSAVFSGVREVLKGLAGRNKLGQALWDINEGILTNFGIKHPLRKSRESQETLPKQYPIPTPMPKPEFRFDIDYAYPPHGTIV